MNPEQTSQPKGLTCILVGSSIPILFILVGLLIEFLKFIAAQYLPRQGVVDTTLENAILFCGLYLALPCGLLDIISGIIARSKGSRILATAGITIGISGIIFGLLAWGLNYVVSQIVF
jgi:hypothetical protein